MNRLHVITLAGLAVLDLAAGAYALDAFTRQPDDAGAVARAVRPLAPAAPPELPAVEPGADAETLARPLFVKSRRPAQARSQASADDGPPPTAMKLRAIVALDENPRAYLVADGAAEGKWLKVGDELGSWTVDLISPMEIALRHGQQTVSIGFDYAEAPEPRAAFAAPPPPPNSRTGARAGVRASGRADGFWRTRNQETRWSMTGAPKTDRAGCIRVAGGRAEPPRGDPCRKAPCNAASYR